MKFPRTPHLPGSKGTADDIFTNYTYTGNVIATEKMDGSNIMMNHKEFITRSGKSSLGSLPEWTYPLYEIHSLIAHKIPKNIWIAGEFLYWQKTIPYNNLPSSYIMFSAIKNNTVLSWKETTQLSQKLNIPLVKTLTTPNTFNKVLQEAQQNWDKTMEGYVIRPTESFPLPQYTSHVAKWVKPDFTTTATHNGKNNYSQKWLNKLKQEY